VKAGHEKTYLKGRGLIETAEATRGGGWQLSTGGGETPLDEQQKGNRKEVGFGKASIMKHVPNYGREGR